MEDSVVKVTEQLRETRESLLRLQAQRKERADMLRSAGGALESARALLLSLGEPDKAMHQDLHGAIGAKGTAFGAEQRHERSSVTVKARMWLNGESWEQMAHAQDIKKAGGVSLNESDGTDTSKDQIWKYDLSRKAKVADAYLLATTILWLGPKLVVLAVPMLVLHIPPMIVVHVYASALQEGVFAVVRSPCFYLSFFLALVLSIPAICLILVSLVVDMCGYYFFSVLYCALTCRWASAYASMRKIDPYRRGPSIIRHLPDFFVCCVGQCARQGVGEVLYMVSCMWMLMPWLKYHINCNPWVYDLDNRLCQQISTEMQDLGSPSEVADMSRQIISCARQPRSTAARIDLWSFVPHYPLPPPERRWALGLQAGGSAYPGKFTLIVHTTHAISDAGGSTEQFVISNSCEQPIYRVMLWYSNPFHFLTGWVEASVSTGMPSQPDKYHGGEHPMWLVTGRTPQVAGRSAWTGSGMIDAFFDYWLPVFVHEMRRLTFAKRFQGRPDADARALDVAEAKYEEVHSQDGVSRPIGKRGRKKYAHKDALSDFQAGGS